MAWDLVSRVMLRNSLLHLGQVKASSLAPASAGGSGLVFTVRGMLSY